MLIHLGGGVSVHGKNIIALKDLQHAQPLQAETLVGQYRREGRLRVLTGEPKTLLICSDGAESVCYLSSVGLRTLRRRMELRFPIEMREVQHG